LTQKQRLGKAGMHGQRNNASTKKQPTAMWPIGSKWILILWTPRFFSLLWAGLTVMPVAWQCVARAHTKTASSKSWHVPGQTSTLFGAKPGSRLVPCQAKYWQCVIFTRRFHCFFYICVYAPSLPEKRSFENGEPLGELLCSTLTGDKK